MRNWRTTALPSRSVGATPGEGSSDEASAERLKVASVPARPPPTTEALPSLSTRITVGGCTRTYMANPSEAIASTPKIIASSMARFA